MTQTAAVLALMALATPPSRPTIPPPPRALRPAAARAVAALAARHGDLERARAERGVAQAAAFWRPGDGDAKAFETFCAEHFLPRGPGAPPAGRAARGGAGGGRRARAGRRGRRATRSARGGRGAGGPRPRPPTPPPPRSSTCSREDAFVALLNFPLTSLDERLATGRALVPARVGGGAPREPVRPARARGGEPGDRRAAADADHYIAGYNLWMHHVLAEDGERLFPTASGSSATGTCATRSRPATPSPTASREQRVIAKVMERIVDARRSRGGDRQPARRLEPVHERGARPRRRTRSRRARPPREGSSPSASPDTRYATLLAHFRAVQAVDPYSPTAPTHIARRSTSAEMPEARVARCCSRRCSTRRSSARREARSSSGSAASSSRTTSGTSSARRRDTEAELDAITREALPDAAAFAKDLPRSCSSSASRREGAQYSPSGSRSIPRAAPATRSRRAARGDKAHLRTRVGAGRHGLQGLQHRGPRARPQRRAGVLALRRRPHAARRRAEHRVHRGARVRVPGAIAGVGAAARGHAADRPRQWNRWYAPVFGVRDVPLLAIYSHMVSNLLYLPTT